MFQGPCMIWYQMQTPKKGLSSAVMVAVWRQPDTGSDSMSLSPDESALLLLQAQICSVVFSALLDPSVQLQLVGIKALTVLGSLKGWCLFCLETEGGVTVF